MPHQSFSDVFIGIRADAKKCRQLLLPAGGHSDVPPASVIVY
jgi:hypothetical protein